MIFTCRYFQLLVLIIGIGCSSCSVRKSKAPKDLLFRNSTEGSRVLDLSGKYDFQKLVPLDTVFIRLLSGYSVIAKTYAEYKDLGCNNQCFYYSHFQLNEDLTAAVFAQSVCSCCGDDQLIFAIMDKEGHITDAIIAAEDMNASECVISKSSIVKGWNLVLTEKEECGILEGPDQGRTSIDSTTLFYNITVQGKIKLSKKQNIKLVRG